MRSILLANQAIAATARKLARNFLTQASMTIDADFYIRSIISMLVITSAFDPLKILFFNQAISDSRRRRTVSPNP
ncbi:MAG: hypothetical protein AB4290_08205 [Spirulina sp.]